MAWPTPRFEVRGATVCDRLTELVWLREADAAAGPTSWEGALAVVRGLDRHGPGDRWDWRLPTTSSYQPDWAMVSHLDRGAVGVGPKAASRAFRVWPVAGR